MTEAAGAPRRPVAGAARQDAAARGWRQVETAAGSPTRVPSRQRWVPDSPSGNRGSATVRRMRSPGVSCGRLPNRATARRVLVRHHRGGDGPGPGTRCHSCAWRVWPVGEIAAGQGPGGTGRVRFQRAPHRGRPSSDAWECRPSPPVCSDPASTVWSCFVNFHGLWLNFCDATS